MEITLDNSNIGTVGGDFLCHNTMHYHTHIHSSVATPGRVRGYMPAPYGRLFGRDEDIQEIIQILIGNSASGSSNSKPVRFALLGAGGQGKTALVLEVMAQLAMKECYSAENSIWVPCEKASSPALLVDVLFTSLDIRKDIRKDSHNTIQHIRHELHASPDPVILLLDNFETPWNASEARGAVARILRDIAQISHVTIFITMRAPTAPCKDIIWVEKNIQSLDPEASLKLYASIDPRLQHDNKLPELLGMLGHMALAVKLMAQHGNNTGYTVEQLISGYKITGTAMLGRSKGSDPQNSVSVSICMSLESPLVKDQVNASRLLTIIAVLPSGTTVDALRQYWAPDLDDLDATLPTLIETSLLERRNQTYFVLPVIRSYLLDPSRLPNDVRESMVDAACNFLQQHPSVTPGDSSFPDDMTARSIEEINLQAILLQASEPKTKVVAACYILASHQYQVRPRMEVIEHAVKLVSEVADQNVIGQVYHCSATMLIGLNRFDESLQQYKLTRDAFIAASRPALAALTLLDIAHVSVSMDPSKNEIHLIEQAQQELVSINTPQPIRRKWTLLRLFTPLRNRYKKTASTEAKPGNLVEESMAQCLRRLGCAHSRWGNYSDAIQYLEQARDSCLHSSCKADCAQSLAEAYRRLQQLDQAEKWGVLAINEWKEIGGDLGYPLWVLGMIYNSKGKYDQAITRLEEGLECAKAHGNQRQTANCLLELGRAHMKKENTDNARRSFQEALVYYRDWPGISTARKIICQFYLDKLDNPLRNPTLREQRALTATDHDEDRVASRWERNLPRISGDSLSSNVISINQFMYIVRETPLLRGGVIHE